MWKTSDTIDWTLDDEKQYKEGLLNRLSTTNESIKEKFPWSNELEEQIKLLETTNPLSIEDALENNEEIFGKIRAAQKKNGDIFLYGKPTPKIMDIMIKLYHENIFRVLKGKYEKKDRSKMMCGIVELITGEIYVTLSESPYDGGNDSEYPKKIKDFYSLLKNGGINVTYPEKEILINKNKNKEFPLLIPSNLFPDTTEIWHTVKSNNYIYSPVNLTQNQVDYENVFKEMFIDNVDNTLNKIKINEVLTNCKYEVKLIHSLDYLNIRKSNLDMASQNKNPFVPFIRRESYDKKYPQPYISCNNGSTCVESKLFSYIYDTLHLKFDDIAGFVSYWIGDELPPNHIIGSYCYKSGDKKNPEENRKLEGMLDECIGFLNHPPPNTNKLPTCNIYNDIQTKFDPTTIHNIMKNVVQPIALACPGCLSNYYYYTQNKRDQPFNYNICYGNWKKKRSMNLPETSMEDKVSGGGRRKTKTRCRKSKTHRRKTKTHRKKTKTRRRFT